MGDKVTNIQLAKNLVVVSCLLVLASCSNAKSRKETKEDIAEFQLTQTSEVGNIFQDCQYCPAMVTIPAGEFMMGNDDFGPIHLVTIKYQLAIAQFETTYQEWQDCVNDQVCIALPQNKRSKVNRDKRPVANITWHDAKNYVKWLSDKTAQSYRLLSESEWEYAARAGTTSVFYWGDELGKNNANCDDCDPAWEGRHPVAGGSQKANAFGLYDMSGNISEWVEDCAWDMSYRGAPNDGSAWIKEECRYRGLRGGSYLSHHQFIRSANRYEMQAKDKHFSLGLRIARDIK